MASRPAGPCSLPALFAGAALALGCALPASTSAATLTAARDNTLFFDAAGALSNGAGPVFFVGSNSQGSARRGLVYFDLAAAVPPGSIVTGVELRLVVSNAPNSQEHSIALHRVLSDWGEGASWATGGTGDSAQSGDATWLHTFYPNRFWSSPGGDFAASPSSSAIVGGIGPYVWSGPGLVADVQNWIDHPSQNRGWLLHGDETQAATARRFESRESTTPSSRPELSIEIGAVSVPGPSLQPFDLAIESVAPNPTSGVTRFAFLIPAPGHAVLTIEDVSGRCVATLLDRRMPAGRHQLTWEGDSNGEARIGSGIYFCRLVLDGHRSLARRLVVVR